MRKKEKIVSFCVILILALPVFWAVGEYIQGSSDFRESVLSNLIATYAGVILGVLAAFVVERQLDNWREDSRRKKNEKHISHLLDRLLTQIANIEQQIKLLNDQFLTKQKILYYPITQVEIISRLQARLSDLDAKIEILYALDFFIADLLKINSLLETSKHVGFSSDWFKEMEKQVQGGFSLSSELNFIFTATNMAIKNVRVTMAKKYPDFWESVKQEVTLKA